MRTHSIALGNFFRVAISPIISEMRITNNVISRNAQNSLQNALRAVDKAQHQATTGKRVNLASDDPAAAMSVMRSSSSLRAIEQYSRNIDSATARANAEENVLTTLSTMLERAKELGLGQAGSNADAATRLTTKAEIDQILAQAVQMGNVQHEGEYLFAGDQTGTPPFQGVTPPFAAVPPTGTRRTEISTALYVQTNHNGSEVFLNSNVLASLEQLSAALGANDPQAITASLTSLDTAHANVQVLIGETGSRTAQLEVSQQNLAALSTSLATFKSNLQDVDLEKAVTELVSRQTAYQTAMLATSRVLGMNLAEYLR